MAWEAHWLFPDAVCVCLSVCELTAPSMSHFKVLSLPASWHLLTPTIIMLIYIVWLHKVIYAHIDSMAVEGCMRLLLNVLKRKFHDRLILCMASSASSLFAFLHFSHLSFYFVNKVWWSAHKESKASAYWENNSGNHQLSLAALFMERRRVEITFLTVLFSSLSEM